MKDMKNFLKYIKGHERAYLVVWMCLLVLTVITVWVSYYNYGIFNIVVAMLVATIKASLVCLYFMHLKYDNRLNQVVFASSFVFLALFVGLTGSDLLLRKEPTAQKIKLAHPLEVRTHAHENLSVPSKEAVERGRVLHQTYCITCHSMKRVFTGQPKDVYRILTEGLPGTTMPSFADLGERERWALIHFILSKKD